MRLGPTLDPGADIEAQLRDIEARFADDPHMDATVLHRELVAVGFDRSSPTLVRELRRLDLRPV